ncbi:cation-transporting P-type ATPase [Actinoplanes oblitus]|uniref:Cation-transporting P-type ATPase n=1 Tax=Actinoplanes oblitus TaxID=3040509 RepID=A0ABY8WHL2_9ACTN|nr:cation-transporting P-type ATPase [Actinoplanes oblitus]WIM97315.1 cation-transporting P-type ATPase [Actinoplanes oblitus]
MTAGAARLAAPDAGGLSSSDAAQRLARDGGNVLPSPRPTPLWRRIVTQLRDPLVVVLLAAVTISIGVWAHATDRPWQTLTFLARGLTQLAVAVGSRARPGTWANPMLFAAVGTALLLQLAAIYAPALRQLLGTEPVTGTDLLIVAAAATLGYAAIRIDRRVHPSPRNPHPDADARAGEDAH